MPRVIRAFSFQSELTFAEAVKLLVGQGPFGEWMERDSAWYDNLLSCYSHDGVWMNLYFFPDENILELKFTEPDSEQGRSILAFALDKLLPALRARGVKPTSSVN